MGAALHLAHVQAAPVKKQKRKGGGGGSDGYDALVRRVYQDRRMTPESRELILLLAWLAKRDPDRYDANGNPRSVWKRAIPILGEYKGYRGRTESRLGDLINADRPRYEPDMHDDIWQHRVCAAPMIRRNGECGQHAIDHSLIVDPATGWRTPAWYCRRHTEWGRKLDTALRASGPVEPIPNKGGLMPSYLRVENGDRGWISVYQRASDWKMSRWEPPTKYGLRADDWPLPGKETEAEPVRLHLVALDGELVRQ